MDLTKKELLSIAKEMNLKNRSKMSVQELKDAIFKSKKDQDGFRMDDDEIEKLGSTLEINFKHKTRNSRLKQIANELARRLCDCVKQVSFSERIDESRAIAICKSSVLKNRGVDLYSFKCKDKDGNLSPRAIPKKGTKLILKKVEE